MFQQRQAFWFEIIWICGLTTSNLQNKTPIFKIFLGQATCQDKFKQGKRIYFHRNHSIQHHEVNVFLISNILVASRWDHFYYGRVLSKFNSIGKLGNNCEYKIESQWKWADKVPSKIQLVWRVFFWQRFDCMHFTFPSLDQDSCNQGWFQRPRRPFSNGLVHVFIVFTASSSLTIMSGCNSTHLGKHWPALLF